MDVLGRYQGMHIFVITKVGLFPPRTKIKRFGNAKLTHIKTQSNAFSRNVFAQF